MTDGELAARAVGGDDDSFAVLVRRHQSRLRGFLLRLARGERALADDLAQDTFLQAWRRIAQYRGEGSFAGWLTRIGYTRYLMEARRRKLEPLDDNADPSQLPDTVEPEMRFDLERALARLSLAERATLTLCHAIGYSNEEAAEILAMPVGTLKSHILRGRKKLQAMLEAAP
jgi:RNA polymerase sigma-70 factor (ECF subfamily)